MSFCGKHKYPFWEGTCWRCREEALKDEHLIEAVTSSLEPHTTLTCDFKDGEFKNGRR